MAHSASTRPVRVQAAMPTAILGMSSYIPPPTTVAKTKKTSITSQNSNKTAIAALKLVFSAGLHLPMTRLCSQPYSGLPHTSSLSIARRQRERSART